MLFHQLHVMMATFFIIEKKMQIRTLLISASLALSLTNCMSYDFSRRVVQQGNLLSPQKIERLKIGMSKNDAAILMGTSLISPTFNDNRWDYAFTSRRGNSPMEVCSLTLYFSHDQLTRIERKP